jgi:2-polyprenyl-3-methyl-5-hydroxy-6-metoxy-1,4-benzoquinol methylase
MYLKKNPSGKVLEIGCGDGGRLAKIKELGWVIEGQEIDPIAGKKAEMKLGVRIHIGPIAKLKLKESSYDAIIMNHVIEHIHNPIETLTEVHRMLKPQGMLVIVTPNMQSRGHGRFGRYWLGLDPPRHLFLYNPDSLQALVSKLAFTIDSCRTTAANAELLASGSLSIQRSGKYVMGKSQPLTILVRSMCFQLVESLFGIVDFHKSDETVLIAYKTRNSIQS